MPRPTELLTERGAEAHVTGRRRHGQHDERDPCACACALYWYLLAKYHMTSYFAFSPFMESHIVLLKRRCRRFHVDFSDYHLFSIFLFGVRPERVLSANTAGLFPSQFTYMYYLRAPCS